MNLRPGDLLLSTYRVERPLGRGGAGEVVCAEHLRLGQRVAIKILREERSLDARPRARMDREARAAARLRGEHAARIFDLHQLPDGRPVVVMELVVGPSLADLISERGALPFEEAVDCVLQLCEGLAEAHALGIIHRDIKPSNLLLTRRPDGSPLLKIVDFGLATLPSLERITQSEAMLGSPPYMSPEQIRSPRDVDERSDVWSAAVVLYELCTGLLPWSGYTSAGILASITADAPLPALAKNPALPPEIDALFASLLQKDRDLRPSSVAALALALAPFHPEGQARAARVEKIRRALPLDAYEPPGALASPASPPSLSATEEPPSPVEPSSAPSLVLEPRPASTPAPRKSNRVSLALAAAALLATGIAFSLRSPAPAAGARATEAPTTTPTAAPTTAASTAALASSAATAASADAGGHSPAASASALRGSKPAAMAAGAVTGAATATAAAAATATAAASAAATATATATATAMATGAATAAPATVAGARGGVGQGGDVLDGLGPRK